MNESTIPASTPPAPVAGSDLAAQVDEVLRHSLAAATITPEAKALLDAVKAKANTPLLRFLVYRSSESRTYLCVCAARDKRHALKIARQMFRLGRTAFAIRDRNSGFPSTNGATGVV